jgi:Mor family transcriptional regulator
MMKAERDMSTERVLERLRGDFKGLARIVGIDNALKISAEFGGLTIHIPKLDTIRGEERDARIRQDYDEGAPVTKLARRYRLTKRRVYAILKGKGE